MLELADKATEKNLKAAVGLMCRHCDARGELHDRIQDGQLGDIILMRAYRQQGPLATAFSTPKPDDQSELEYQIRRFHSFLWASGGAYSDFNIHNIDECCWMKDAWPVEARGTGARTYRGDYVDQNFDCYSTEYTFADGSKLYMEGRNIPGCEQEFASYAHGSKGSAVISTSSHTPAKCMIFDGQKISRRARNAVWAYPQPERNPYQIEWDKFIAAIREDKPYNEVRRGVEASIVTSMGRMACHTGQVVTFDDMLNHEHEFAPGVADLSFDGPAPLQVDESGHYPWPEPGIKKTREF
jgi:predicted dehydrogenase